MPRFEPAHPTLGPLADAITGDLIDYRHYLIVCRWDQDFCDHGNKGEPMPMTILHPLACRLPVGWDEPRVFCDIAMVVDCNGLDEYFVHADDPEPYDLPGWDQPLKPGVYEVGYYSNGGGGTNIYEDYFEEGLEIIREIVAKPAVVEEDMQTARPRRLVAGRRKTT